MSRTGHNPNKRVHSTRVAVTIYRRHGDPIQLTGSPTYAPEIGPGPAVVVGVTSSKRIGSQSGTFQITLKPGKLDIQREIRAGDWVVFHWQRNGQNLHGTLGIVVRVRRSRNSLGGVTSESFTLECEDWARVINKTQIWFDDYSNYETNVGGKILASRMNFDVGGSPDQVVARIIDAWLGQDGIVGGAWVMPRGLDEFGPAFADGLFAGVQGAAPVFVSEAARSQGKLRGEMFDESVLFQPQPGSMLGSFVEEWSNPILNEIWFDVSDIDGFPERPVPVVYMREKPFVNVIDGADSPWFRLPTVRVARDAILTDDVATNDDERITLFQIYATPGSMINFEQYALFPPSYSREDAAQYGIRKYERVSKFASFGGRSEGPNWIQELREWHTLMTSWYAPNHLWLAGTITLPFLMPEARVGKRLIVNDESPEKREQFYIEGVVLKEQFPHRGTTTLTVTRGFKGTDQELVETVFREQEKFRRRGVKVADGLDKSGTTLRLGTSLGLGPDEGIA